MANQTYRLQFTEHFIDSNPMFRNQESNLYEVYANGHKIGQALCDTTSGMCWWFDVYDPAAGQGINVVLTATDFPVSRNRFWYTGTMLPCFVVALVVCGTIAKRNKWRREDVKTIAILIGLGDFAFLLDGTLDIWFNNIMPLLLGLHVVFIFLVIFLQRQYWREAIPAMLELGMFRVKVFLGRIDLVLTYALGCISTFVMLVGVGSSTRNKIRCIQ
ncbi:MAG TPA: hypothetical protein VKK79_25820 [Candidatus Lokiarchaeia archaeon]|nr:hypothetical protein [Candidatus Lokiarchaeia archaeon]